MLDIKGMTLIEYTRLLADELEAADRLGADRDEPEGSRYIQISDTLAKQIIETLREKAAAQ